MSVPYAMAELLHQLLDNRQHRRAEALLGRCKRDALMSLLVQAEHVLPYRAVYMVKERLRRRNQDTEAVPLELLDAMPQVFNIWCWEGYRSSIRAVMCEFSRRELGRLISHVDLDSEVTSIAREFLSLESALEASVANGNKSCHK